MPVEWPRKASAYKDGSPRQATASGLTGGLPQSGKRKKKPPPLFNDRRNEKKS